MIKIFENCRLPEHCFKAAVETFNMSISPRLIKRNKNKFNTEVQAEPAQLSKGSGMIQAASKRCFIIKLHVSGYAKAFPVLDNKADNAVCCFALILFQIGLSRVNINAVNRDNGTESFDVARRYQIKLMHMAGVPGLDFRIILFRGLLFSIFASLSNETVSL